MEGQFKKLLVGSLVNDNPYLGSFFSTRVWFLHSSVDYFFFRRSYFFIMFDKGISKSPSKGP